MSARYKSFLEAVRQPWCARLLLGICAVIALGSSALAQSFVEITAEIDLVAYRTNATNGTERSEPKTVSVVCITGSKEWRIDHDFVRNGKDAWYFDGTNVYNSSRITQPMSERTQEIIAKTSHLATVPFDVAKSNLSIRVWNSQDGNPLGDPAVNIAWLAFCSGSYLKGSSRLIPLPLDHLRHTRDRFAYTDKTETFADGFGLPRTVDLFLSKSLFVASEQDFDKEYFFGDRYTEAIKRATQSLEEGTRMFHYEVTESTNVFGWNFPLQFTFFQNGRRFEQNGDWSWRGTGRVKRIRAAEKPATLFDPSMQQTIVDGRFHDAKTQVDSIVYPSTNAFLSPTNDPVLQEKFAQKAKRVELEAQKSKSKK